jgi:3-aminoavenalumate diazotase
MGTAAELRTVGAQREGADIAESRQAARAALYEDRELGAGNFLFKAYELSATKTTPFLFVEKPFTTPFGETFTEFSLETLRAAVKSLARWYVSRGIGKGACVCTYLENGIPHFMHYLALNSIGAIPVLINDRMSPAIAARYAKEYEFDTFVFDPATEARTKISTLLSGLRHMNAAEAGEGAARSLPAEWPVDKLDDDTVMISHSSGTTGVPKAILFKHQQWFFGKRERLKRFIEEPGDRMIAGIPGSHNAGVSYLMTATLLELPTLVLTQLTGPSVAAHVARFRATIIGGFPQTWASLAEQELPPDALGTLRRFYNTGDAAHEAHIGKLLTLAPFARFSDGLGAGELGMALFEKVSRPGAVASRRCVGRPVPFAESIIIDPGGRQLPPGRVGYFATKSPTITHGYYKRPQLSQLCRFGSYWLTGDVGYRTEEGDFYQLDRGVDVVTTPFGPLYSLVTEEFLHSIPGVHDVTVIGAERTPMKIDSTVALVVPSRGRTADPRAVLDKLRRLDLFDRDLPPFTLCVAIVADPDKLPVGPTGKVLKRSLRDSFWAMHRAYNSGDRSTFLDVLWNA